MEARHVYMTHKKKKNPRRKSAFDNEELIWPRVENSWDEGKLISQTGMFKFSKVKNLLKLTTADLTKISQTAYRQGVVTYEVYGFGKPKGSQYVIRMSRFREFYTNYLLEKEGAGLTDPVQIRAVPAGVENANQLIVLRGMYLLKDICRFSPFRENEEVVKRMVKDERDPEQAKQTNGCWYDRAQREYFVDMQLFVSWFFKRVWVQR